MGDEQADRLLPIANVGRIMKQILPPSAKVSKEAKQRMQECASEFISFVTCEASDRCHKENRKTVNGDDIYWALCSLGLDHHAEATGKYLHKYREFERERALQNKASTFTDEGNSETLNSEELRPTNKPSSLEITIMDRR
ncbi:Nuclear transcription factor Y subunit B-4 [Heracleum sosnowskyi]|uniref:Nuclear transcription factor Y subunit B-4 n=1 Tax=Heracleum sosnowskyi TaxID=360622 RepID=A0AAD8JFT3_9APIA|nr:Nuclear transcription factor Y subunit B-4 [Heracleum sosnowskyi]